MGVRCDRAKSRCRDGVYVCISHLPIRFHACLPALQALLGCPAPKSQELCPPARPPRPQAAPQHVVKAAEKAAAAVELRAGSEASVAPALPADVAKLGAYLAYIKMEQVQADPARVQVRGGPGSGPRQPWPRHALGHQRADAARGWWGCVGTHRVRSSCWRSPRSLSTMRPGPARGRKGS